MYQGIRETGRVWEVQGLGFVETSAGLGGQGFELRVQPWWLRVFLGFKVLSQLCVQRFGLRGLRTVL